MHKRLTRNVRNAIEQAKKMHKTKDLNKISALALLGVIASQKGSLGKALIESLNIKLPKATKPQPHIRDKSKDISVSKILSTASRIAHSSGSPYIGTEHLVYGFLSIPKLSGLFEPKKRSNELSSSGKRGAGYPDFFGEAHSLIENFFATDGARGNPKGSFIAAYCVDLSQSTTVDHPLIGRKNELERISHVLGRKMKNNPVLIGEPGVGKTAIVEGLAQKIKFGNAPYYLGGKRILNLDLGSLIAGTTFRGEFEARLKEIIREAKQNSDVILFIDEIHNLIGAGNAVGGMDAANLLKPAMSRSEIQVIGATTIDEYQKHIEKDAALERRLQPILVNEPSLPETAEILEGIKPFYEAYHNVKVSKDAAIAAANLAKHYITDRFLPDSAIDLIDETAARLRSQTSSGNLFQKLKALEKKYGQITNQKEQLVMTDRYEQAIQMRREENAVWKRLKQLRRKHREIEKKNPITMFERDIRKTLSGITNIPEQLLSQTERSLAKNVKKALGENLVGQSHVNRDVHQAILRQVSGITNPHRPLGSFLFIGPTGVGKTHAAKLLSRAISLKDKDSLIQINMSEFSERHNVSRLLGAPAGYVGYEEGGELTDKIRRSPYSVVLFDEIEKADNTVLNILLQILEEGEIVDAKGRTINFRNTIVILTSNIGTSELDRASQIGFEHGPTKARNELGKAKKLILDQLSDLLAPELLNRLDSTLVFNPLSKVHIRKIVAKELDQLSQRLKNRKVSLIVKSGVYACITNQSVDPAQGARMVRKTIQDKVEPAIASALLRRKKISAIQVGLKGNKIIAQAQ